MIVSSKLQNISYLMTVFYFISKEYLFRLIYFEVNLHFKFLIIKGIKDAYIYLNVHLLTNI